MQQNRYYIKCRYNIYILYLDNIDIVSSVDIEHGVPLHPGHLAGGRGCAHAAAAHQEI